jgi:phospholipid/cholesterol/gamma-HCH transport system permease protein
MANALTSTTTRVGDFASFCAFTIWGSVYTMRRYPREVLRQLADVAWGTGALLVGGGTVGVMVLMSLSAGTSLGIEGFNGLELLGLAPLTGFVSAGVNTRELAPLVAALALGGQVGCRYTAQLGSMRISEEIDALEVMAVEPMRYLVGTRVLAAMFAILPLYLIGLLGSYLASELSVVLIFHQSRGTYEHYFYSFIDGRDIILSVVKILVFATDVALIHCWFGFRAGGGPQGVGEATGRAIRASIVSVVVLDMILTLVFWGHDPGFRVAG